MARLASRSKLTALATALVIAYAAALAAYLLSFLTPVDNAEQEALDWRFLFRGPLGDKPAEIALVTVDEEADLPYWAPMPREHLAKVIQRLAQGGAKLIGVDFYLGSHSFESRGDTLLRRAIAEAGNVVLVSYLDRDEEGQLRENLALPFFQDMALDYGYATFFTGTGVEAVREGRAAIGIEGKHSLALAGCLFAHAEGLDTEEIRRLDWGKRVAALPNGEDDYRRTINYNGPPYQFYRRLEREMSGGIVAIPSHQVAKLPPVLAQKFFKDRIVLLGSGLSDAPDLYRTPFFSQQYDFEKTFGVEIHAHFLHSLLEAESLELSGFFSTALLVMLPAFLAALASVRLRPYLAFPLVVVVIVLVWWLAFYLFEERHTVVPLVMPTLACVLSCLFGLIYVGSTDGRLKNEVRDRFAPMVGKVQLQKLLQEPEAWTSDGEERMVSVLWGHLRPPAKGGQRSARETTAMFQEYWERMAGLLFKHEGAVFRYEDDSLAAVFGAPLSAAQKDHAGQAVLAAVDVMEAWVGMAKDQEWTQWNLAMAVETGRCILGELGGSERYAYRILGRPVDRARALAEAQDGPGEVHIGREVLELVEEHIDAEPVDGTEEIYRVRGRAAAPPIGSADKPPNPFWKYLGLGRVDDDPVSDFILGRLALFSDFNKQDLRHIRPLLHHRTFKAGERIFTQDEVGSGMYIIQRGQVDILQESEEDLPSRLLQRLEDGDFFGELALLNDLRRPASAVAYEPAELLVLFQADLYDLIEREPELGVRLIRSLSRIMGERLIQVNDELIRHQVEERAGE